MAATALRPPIFQLSPSPYPNKTSVPISFNLKLQNPLNSQKVFRPPLSTTNTHRALVARNPKSFKLYCSPAQETTLVAEPEKPQVVKRRKKLFVGNLPRTSSVEALKELFGQCGNVTNAEFIMNKNERGSSFGSVTFATYEEAQAAIEKFDSFEIEGRTIKVEFKKSKKFRSLPSTFAKEIETEHQLYVYNLEHKVRGRHLREFFNEPVKAVSCRVIFNARRSTGYGFVSFATREEAEAALSALNGKELMGRVVRLKLNNKQGVDDSETQADTGSESAEEDHSETGPDDP